MVNLSFSYYDAPINIRSHYPLDGQGWGLVGDLTSMIGLRGGTLI